MAAKTQQHDKETVECVLAALDLTDVGFSTVHPMKCKGCSQTTSTEEIPPALLRVTFNRLSDRQAVVLSKLWLQFLVDVRHFIICP